MKDRTILCFILLSLLLVILFVASLLLGSVSLQVKEVLGVILGQEVDPQTRILVTHFRLPKAITALVVGAALSASGLQMQTLFRNPLAGPYVLGISSGASLGVSLFLLGAPLLGVSVASETLRNIGVVGSAWIGAALILAVIMAVSVRLKDIMAILILGMMFGSAASAIVQILQYLSPDSALKSFVVWTMGSLSGVSLQQLGLMSGIVVAGLALSIYLIKPLNLLLLGENYARQWASISVGFDSCFLPVQPCWRVPLRHLWPDRLHRNCGAACGPNADRKCRSSGLDARFDVDGQRHDAVVRYYCSITGA